MAGGPQRAVQDGYSAFAEGEGERRGEGVVEEMLRGDQSTRLSSLRMILHQTILWTPVFLVYVHVEEIKRILISLEIFLPLNVSPDPARLSLPSPPFDLTSNGDSLSSHSEQQHLLPLFLFYSILQ